jgi:Gamma-glutamyl cyclotransferase, AIG2-like
MTENAILLFSYGTLRQENVQMASFGRLLAGSPDALPGYTSVMVEITASGVVAASGAKFHPMVVETGDPADQVSGTLFLITEAELAAADAYEVSASRESLTWRIGGHMRLRLGSRAWRATVATAPLWQHGGGAMASIAKPKLKTRRHRSA